MITTVLTLEHHSESFRSSFIDDIEDEVAKTSVMDTESYHLQSIYEVAYYKVAPHVNDALQNMEKHQQKS
ncbi:hypothetical protein V6N11_001703 [Hibiscus sabdariffa]|uniref:Uncharacterized protein n=1 Tax=Hibiscus sabdariffa TaxID=183260 RepID=A0ABR2NRA1_9ROSI